MSAARLVRLTVLSLVLLLCATAAFAQSCPPPGIALREAQLCRGDEGQATTAAAGTYAWSITGGHFTPGGGTTSVSQSVTYIATGGEPIQLALTVSDGAGCTSTSTASIPVYEEVPVIVPERTEVCPNVNTSATLAPPSGGGTWSDVTWTIENGRFIVMGPTGPYETTFTSGLPVEFRAVNETSTPVPVTLNVSATYEACVRETSLVLPLRQIDPPTITTSVASLCRTAEATATIDPPAEGTWTDTWWYGTNVAFFVNGQWVPEANGESVRFRASEPGPVTLRASAIDSFGCVTREPGVAVIPERTIPQHTITTSVTSLCRTAEATATIDPPAEGTWTDTGWSGTNVQFLTGDGRWVPEANGESVRFRALDEGPVTLRAFAIDSFGCVTPEPAVAVIPERTVPQHTITTSVTSLCRSAEATATIDPPAEGTWTDTGWSGINVEFLTGDGRWVPEANGESVRFRALEAGPLTLRAFAMDSFGCVTPQPAVAVIPERTVPQHTVTTVASLCRGAEATATIDPPAEGTWMDSGWWGDNVEFFVDGQWTTFAQAATVRFRAIGAGAVTLRSQAMDSFGCVTPGTTVTTIPERAPQTPVITASVTSICPDAQATASLAPPAEGEWTRVDWSIDNGMFFVDGNFVASTSGTNVTFIANTSGPVTLSVMAFDSFGCDPSTPTTLSIPLRTIDPLVITPSVTSLCAYATATATVAPPAEGSWQQVSWSIENGAFLVTDPYGGMIRVTSVEAESVTFESLNSVDPVVLRAFAVDSLGCPVPQETTLTIPLRTIAPPVITTVASMCANGTAFASVAPPAEGSWDDVRWRIVNGDFIVTSPDGNVTRSGYAFGTNVQFVAGTSGPVELEVYGIDNVGCHTDVTGVNIPLRNVEAPAITASATALCPNLPVTASVAPPAVGTWQEMNWTITNGYFLLSDGTQTSAGMGPNVRFAATGAGAVTLRVAVRDDQSCEPPYGELTLPLSTIAAPTITLSHPTTCAGTPITASVAGDYASFEWTIENGTPTEPTSGSSITFTADESTSDVVVRVIAYDVNACSAQASVTVPRAMATAPVIEVPPMFCAGGSASVTLTNAAEYTAIEWGIVSGEAQITSGVNAATVTFTASTPFELSVWVTQTNGCQTSSIVSVPVSRPDAAFVLTYGTSLCANNGYGVAAPDNGPGATYAWSATGATITGSDTANAVVRPIAPGPVSVTLTVTNANGCSATFTQTVNQVDELPPVSIDTPSLTCSRTGNVATASDAGPGATYQWSGNGIVIHPQSDPRTIVYDVGSSPATLLLRVMRGSCDVTVGKQVRAEQPPASITMRGTMPFCEGNSVSLDAPYDSSYTYRWTGPNGFSATGSGIQASEGGSYAVTVTGPLGCSTTSEPFVVTKYATPEPVITTLQTHVCPLIEDPYFSAQIENAASFTSFSWMSNAEITNGITGPSVQVRRVAEGDVWVEVVAMTADGCSVRKRFTAPAKPAPDATITAPDVLCAGATATASMPDAGPSSTYNWFITNGTIIGSSHERTVTFRANGTAPVRLQTNVRDGRWQCLGVGDKYVSVSTADPSISASGPTTFCAGGSVTLTANGGTSWLWSNGATTQSIVVTQSGGYSVAVTNGDACSATSGTVNATVHPAPVVDIDVRQSYDESNGPGYLASGANDVYLLCGNPTVSLTSTLLNPAYAYVWNDGVTGPSRRVSTAGTYRLTVTDTNGCSSSSEVTIERRPLPTPSISGTTTLCPGGSTTLTASGGDAYRWSNGAETQSIVVTEPGLYSVAVTVNGCSASTSANVTLNELSVTADGPTSFCTGGEVTLSASAGATFLWSNGATSPSITVTSSGTYSVRATFADGCVLESTPVAVTVSGPRYVNISVDDTSACPNQPLTFTSSITGGSNLTYQWLDAGGNAIAGATSPSLTMTPSQPGYGSVSLRVEENGCAVTSEPLTYYVFALETPSITALGPTTFCPGGSVTLAAPEGEGYTYRWSNGAESREIVAMAAGAYSVTVFRNGCSATSAPVTVAHYEPPAKPSIDASGPLTFCEGGSVTLTAPDGYAYFWPATGASSRSITVTASGVFVVSITDANGCTTASDPVSVTVHPRPAATIAVTGDATFCDGGSVTLTASAGASYFWPDTNETSRSITVSASGSYEVVVTNANGCSATSAPVVVTERAPLAKPTITVTGDPTFCDGGSVTLTAPDGFTYLWPDTGVTDRSITVSSSGSYEVVITDANGCSATSDPVVVTERAPLAKPTITVTGDPTFCDGGSVTLTAPDGFTYVWPDTGATDRSITVSSSGSYEVVITDANGCSATSDPVVVTERAPLAKPSVVVTGDPTFCDGGSVTLTAPDGFTYLWPDTGAISRSIVVSSSGSYEVVITDANGCSATSDAVVVTERAPLAKPTITVVGNATFCDGGSVTLTAPDGFTYLWPDTGAISRSIVVSSSGSYEVVITDANGCSATSDPIGVTERAPLAAPVVSAGGPTTICPLTQTVTLTAPDGFASYFWPATGTSGRSITVSAAGQYEVVVTDANGCTATSAPVQVSHVATTSITTHPQSRTIARNTSATLEVVAGGSGTLTYQWQRGSSANGPWTNVGTNGATYTTPKLGKGTYWYRVVVTGGCGQVTSNVATISVP